MSLPPPLPPSSAPAELMPYQMAPVSDDAEAKPKPTACVSCGSIPFSTLTKLPLCEPCRLGLVKFPFPLWVKAAALIVASLVVVSLALSRERIQAAIHIAHTKKMKREGRWEEAYQGYQSIIANHNDTPTLLDYAETAINSGHVPEASRTMKTLAGRQASREQNVRANAILDRLARLPGGSASQMPSYRTTEIREAFQLGQPSIQLQTGQPMPMNHGPAPQINLGQPIRLNNAPIQLQTR